MENLDVLNREEDSIFSPQKGDKPKSRGALIEKKIEFLETLACKVSNRCSRRWLNDRLLIELVPRLNVEEIRGLFAPPPWGDTVPLSPFCMTNVEEWDAFRNIDMDKEAMMLEKLRSSSTKRNGLVDTDRRAAMNAWHRVDCRTREALRRNFLSQLLAGFEECIRAFVNDNANEEVLVLHVQDPYHRLLLHGVCEFYDLISVTVTKSKEAKLLKMTKISKKKSSCSEIPGMTLTHFLKTAKKNEVML